MRATAEAPSNVAFVKYWGRKDEELRLPTNGSISMNLSNCKTITTVSFEERQKEDYVLINGEKEEGEGFQKISRHLDRIRKIADVNIAANVVSENTFPRSTGISSSASGFAALTLAASEALGLRLSEEELSILARQGSGSACRSIPDGFVEWLDGHTSESSYAVSIFPPDHWDLVDVVCVLSEKRKKIPTSIGQKSSESSPYFADRIREVPERIEKIKLAIKDREFQAFGELLEMEALDLHRIMETSVPPLYYMTEDSREMIGRVKEWREKEFPVYFTLNTGENIHLICESENKEKLLAVLQKEKPGLKTIVNVPSEGARIIEKV